MADTILVYGLANPASLMSIPVDQFEAENAAAEEAGNTLPWTACEGDAGNDAPTFDDLDEEGQAEVLARQAANEGRNAADAE